MYQLDEMDRKILEMLQQDARTTLKEMAAALDVSTTPIFERIKRLEKKGIIKQYVAILDSDKLGIKLNAFAHISLKEHSKIAVQAFISKIITFPEVMECHAVSGGADFMLKVLVKDIEDYNHFIQETLWGVPNIGKIESLLSLSTIKKTTKVNLET